MTTATQRTRAGNDAAPHDFLTMGPVHLDVVDAARSLTFWRDVVRLVVRRQERDEVELGTETDTLVVLHPGAVHARERGRTGLYHVALIVPSEPELARVLARLVQRRVRMGATDHTVAKSLYLNDPDGIGLEIAFETPQRMREMRATPTGIEVIDADGRVRSGNDPLDVEELLGAFPASDLDAPIANGTTVGHVHLSVPNLDTAYSFYRDRIGLLEHFYGPHIGFGDLSSGGLSTHRLGVNVWSGPRALPPSPGSAGLRHFTLRYDSTERLNRALERLGRVERMADGCRALDPFGNAMVLTA